MQSQVALGSSAPITIGTTVSGLLVDINGLNQEPLSIISQLSSQGITLNVFSHYLQGDGNGGGILILGEIMEPSTVYTPLSRKKSHYIINLESIAVNGQILPIDPIAFRLSNDQGIVVDSGMTLAFIAEEAYDPFIREVKLFAEFANNMITLASGIQSYLTYTRLALSLSNLNDIILAESFPIANLNFAADHVLRDKIVVYDLARHRLGWASYNCSSPVNFSMAIHRSGRSIKEALPSSNSVLAVQIKNCDPLVLGPTLGSYATESNGCWAVSVASLHRL
ncbi:hypothetical protein DVH24_000029 [Malus domestica]|uniref:Xylanase inhibitor C-terminal domain-containing protein n=1 Tax=Malus domestica TaxID=3750 RepID=A0A498IYV0_MALDO|nr:hypothetical protein DVH24_000029 [Malus domestica]